MDVKVAQTISQLLNLSRRDRKGMGIGPGSTGWEIGKRNDNRRIHSRRSWSMNVGYGRIR